MSLRFRILVINRENGRNYNLTQFIWFEKRFLTQNWKWATYFSLHLKYFLTPFCMFLRKMPSNWPGNCSFYRQIQGKHCEKGGISHHFSHHFKQNLVKQRELPFNYKGIARQCTVFTRELHQKHTVKQGICVQNTKETHAKDL